MILKWLRNFWKTLFVFFLIFYTSQSQAADGPFLPGYMAINEGMAGAGIALPLDTSVLLNNPAGLGDLPPMVNTNFTMVFPHSVMSTSDAPFGNPEAVNVGSNDDPAILPGGGSVFPVNKRISLGTGAFAVAGFGVDFPISRTPVPDNAFDNHSFFGLLKIIAAASYKIHEKLSVGAAFHLNRSVLETNTSLPDGTQTAGLDKQDAAIGFGFGLGVLYKPFAWLSMGLNYTSEQYFDEFERYLDIAPQGVNIPQQLQVGLAVTPLKNLKVATDFFWINNEGAGGALGTPITEGGLGWQDQYGAKVGVQYQPIENLIVRTGYNYVRPLYPSNAAFVNINNGTGGNQHVAAGVGLRFPNHKLLKHSDFDFSYIHTFQKEITDDGSIDPGFAGARVATAIRAFSVEFGLRF